MRLLTHVQLSARPLPWANFYLRRLARFNKLCTILHIVFHQSFHEVHSPRAGCLQWLPISQGGWCWQKTLQWDRKFYLSWRRAHSMVSSRFCSHTAPHYHFFNTILSGWWPRGKAAFAEDISLRMAIFLGNSECVDDRVLSADFLTQEIRHIALVYEQDKIKQLNCQ